MKKLAVITATPPGINPGMLACEATARTFLSRAGLLHDCTFFRVRDLGDGLRHLDSLQAAEIVAACDIGTDFTHLSHESQLRGLAPVFWGDFLHMHAYQRAISVAHSGGLPAIFDLLLLAGAPDTQRRSISYGTSCLFNSTADYCDPHYGPAFENLFENAFHVQMRDAVSAAVVAGIRRRQENCFGIDPAQLLSLSAYESAIVGDSAPALELGRIDRAAVFFARGKHDWNRLEGFLEKLMSSIGVRAEWIPWGDTLSFPYMDSVHYRSTVPQIPKDRQNANRLQSLLRTIRESRCVITDTYHLAVISWAIGVPAVVIPGDHHDPEKIAKTATVRVRHDKRKVILSQDRLLDFYVEPYLIASSEYWAEIIDRLSQRIHAHGYSQEFRRRLAGRAAASEAALLAAIQQTRQL